MLRKTAALVLPRLADRHDYKAFEAGVALAERPDTPEEVLAAMVTDKRATPEFRKVIARRTTHAPILELLKSDRSARVRRAAERPP